uniref:Proliferating cell nuclear antigen n=1 Tax=Megaviridae environmental sample TaxID=1737588 RepID=A0A5J6VMG1_9VIRU|nr:MAG: proliferating cell nuclear antigen [Megaviridae environmental sample]
MVNILELKTTQTGPIKILIDTLNSLLNDVSITFYPYNIDENTTGGIIIKEVNKTNSILVHCKLDADKFNSYSYNYKLNKLTIGINLNNFLKCLKCMNNFDTMYWSIDSDDINKLVMILENDKEKKTFRINLMDLENINYEIEPIEFPYSIVMNSSDFHKYCKDMSSTTNKIEIKCTKNTVIFSGKGDIGVIDFELPTTTGGLLIDTNNNKDSIVQGWFELKYLIIFTKCTNLCNQVTLFLKNDYPLIVQYSVAALGDIKLVLSQSKPKDYF